jgi:hypothetical protein
MAGLERFGTGVRRVDEWTDRAYLWGEDIIAPMGHTQLTQGGRNHDLQRHLFPNISIIILDSPLSSQLPFPMLI